MTDLHFRSTTTMAFQAMVEQFWFTIGPNHKLLGGVIIGHIRKGALTHIRATYDQDGNELTPVIVDANHEHYNVRLGGAPAAMDLIAGTDEDGFDTSAMRVWFRDNGILINHNSTRRPGTEHTWWRHEFAPGGLVELVWPAPKAPRRVWI